MKKHKQDHAFRLHNSQHGAQCCLRSDSKTLLLVALALLLCSQPAVVGISNIGDPHVSVRCPSWLEDYKAWHAANKGKPDATYLVCARVRVVVVASVHGMQVVLGAQSPFAALQPATCLPHGTLPWLHVRDASLVHAPLRFLAGPLGHIEAPLC